MTMYLLTLRPAESSQVHTTVSSRKNSFWGLRTTVGFSCPQIKSPAESPKHALLTVAKRSLRGLHPIQSIIPSYHHQIANIANIAKFASGKIDTGAGDWAADDASFCAEQPKRGKH